MGKYAMPLEEYLAAAGGNARVQDAIVKAAAVLTSYGYKRIAVMISGGSDSDVMIDMCERIGAAAEYVYIDVGLDYQATKEHLAALEEKYGIVIERVRAEIPIPLAVKRYGVPCVSKNAAEKINRLQRSGFTWTDEEYEVIAERFPGQGAAVKWWTNRAGPMYSISRNRYLKDYMIEHPPEFMISAKCCEVTKKATARRLIRERGCDLECVGIRRAEGGARRTAYTSCFDAKTKEGVATFRPLFWLEKADKEYYEAKFGVTHSRLYTEYGFARTGCVCCPFSGRAVWDDMEATRERDPALYRAAWGVFGAAYEYMRGYYDYRRRRTEEEAERNPKPIRQPVAWEGKATIAEARRKSGMTQAQLAGALGVTQGAVSQWEAALTFPRREIVERMAGLFGCAPEDLIRGG